MKFLFVHQNFPGQFKSLAPTLASQSGVTVASLSMRSQPQNSKIRSYNHTVERGSTAGLHPTVTDFETKMLRALSAVKAAEAMKAEGFTPDVIIAHPGWGESLLLSEIWPQSRQLHFLEFFYHSSGVDTDFDPEFALPTLEQRARVSSKRAAPLWALAEMDWGLSPTQWQKETYPVGEWSRISVIHDGIDTRTIKPNPEARITLKEAGLVLKPGDPVITFVNRNLEPYRGYHIFMRALPEILERHPTAQVLIVGGDSVSYGAAPPVGSPSWKQRFYDEVADRIDRSRVHFLGNIPYQSFLGMLQVSAVHVYLTYPFVLSWSLLEAMATECLIVGSRTAPVMEVIEDGKDGVLVDFFDPSALAAAVLDGLARPDHFRAIRRAARQKIVERYDLATVCLPAQINLIDSVFQRPRAHHLSRSGGAI
ncbi:MAG: glycosyltransferase family 4 protein [Aquidulcibacter sp.]